LFAASYAPYEIPRLEARPVEAQPASATGQVAIVPNGDLHKVPIQFRQYSVYSVLFGWEVPIDSSRALTDFMKIASSQLGIGISLKSYSFRPSNPQQSYDQRPPATMIGEVVSDLRGPAGSRSNELIIILSSMFLPTAQGGSQAYFLNYLTAAGERNAAILWGRDGGVPAIPARQSLLPLVLAHEFGHFLGYQHEDDPKCIMYSSPQEGSSFRNCKQFSGPTAPQAAPSAQSPASLAASKGACIIATTAFGSELAPQVAFLRKFRDAGIGSTSEGRGFMAVFNSWYYSFSPYAADIVGQSTAGKDFTRTAIYPLLGLLSISERLQLGLGGEAGALAAGSFAAFAIGLIYFGIPVGLVARAITRRVAARGALICASVPVIAAFLLLAPTDGALRSGAAVALVLGCVAAGAMAASAALTNLLRGPERAHPRSPR